MSDNRLELVEQIQKMGSEKFALALLRMSPEQRDSLMKAVQEAPKVAAEIKQVIVSKIREDVKGIPALAETLIDYAKAFGGLFDDENPQGVDEDE